MYKKLYVFTIAVVLFLFSSPVFARYTGTMPVPVFTDAGVEAIVVYDAVEGLYSYTYTVTNPGTNTGEIWTFDIDISKPRNGMELSGEGLTILYGSTTITFDKDYNDMRNPELMVPVGIKVPSGIGWQGSIAKRGFGGFFSGNFAPLILPGQSLGGFELYSRGLPGIRDVEIQPDWDMVEEVSTPEGTVAAREIEKELTVTKKTIGPTAPPAGSYSHLGGQGALFGAKMLLEKIFGYIDESVTLEWLTDTTLANSLRAKLTAAKQSMDASETTQAKAALGEFMALLDGSSASQRTNEGYGLLYFNAKYLKDNLPDDYIPPVTILNLAPVYASLPMGATSTLTALYTTDGEPLAGASVSLEITSGPNTGLTMPEPRPGPPPPPGSRPPTIYTDMNGQAVFSYTSKLLGTDELTATTWGEAGATYSSESVKVNWEGGPDLVIDMFIPPIIKAKGGETVNLKEVTVNTGSESAGPFVIRYFISDDEIIDPATDISIGERSSSSLAPGAQTVSGKLAFVLPAAVPDGTYFLGACADADNKVGELDEDNNCHANQVVVMVERNPNQPPVCDQAFPSIASLWPPNHKTVKTGIVGVTDPDGDEIALQITGITQDEPVNGLGDGDTSPDGFGVGLSKAELRAERSGTGNGRVYAVRFAAADGKGGECAGSVNVTVPHDKGKAAAAIDDGQAYDSTLP